MFLINSGCVSRLAAARSVLDDWVIQKYVVKKDKKTGHETRVLGECGRKASALIEPSCRIPLPVPPAFPRWPPQYFYLIVVGVYCRSSSGRLFGLFFFSLGHSDSDTHFV